jgi:hypothetical protein
MYGQETQKVNVTKRNIWKPIVVTFVVLLLLDVTPLSGNTIVYVKWIECGTSNIQQNAAVYTGEVPHYVNVPKFALLRGMPKYCCTPEAAEKAGYSADSENYGFPHLPASEFQQAVQKSQSL